MSLRSFTSPYRRGSNLHLAPIHELLVVHACGRLEGRGNVRFATVLKLIVLKLSDSGRSSIQDPIMRALLFASCCSAMLLFSAAETRAQGLVWNLPPDGTWVRYEGTYQQVIRRPDSAEGDLTLQWQRNLEIKSVGQEEAEHDLDYDGETTTETCRWLEFKLQTGKVVEGIIDTGPGATRIYKVLVPESILVGELTDAAGIPYSYLPIVRGYRRLGDEAPQEMTSNVLQIYPVLSLLRYYRDLQADDAEQSVEVPSVGGASATRYTGSLATETTTSRSTTECELLVSEQMPFGVVSWTAKTVNELKNPTEPRSTFVEVVELSEQLTAVEIRDDGETELVTE
ncbi:MAG: hypothetical protein DWQ29_10510 [Planctomycetota bacterium]|nr:MAG: hypothetical protein DWQ29_10510 [Planctomycetota bacterium]REK20824.1 MAG: hypothetical protein DWQ41_23555 [Planctomycetota bacterium]